MTKRTIALAGSPLLLAAAAAAAAACPAGAASLDLKIELPRKSVAEFHRPYVAMWIEGGAGPARTLNVWYEAKNREDGGRKWLADLRQWWRRSGRTLSLPADGLSGATRAPGPQAISFGAGHPALKDLAPGQYQLAVEAARELGAQEVVKVPFSWPPKAPTTTTAKGALELGAITVVAKP